jgi:hypothetical protein
VIKNRSRRIVIAAIVSILWLGYMVIGLVVIDSLVPTVRGAGPEGLAAFVGLIGGIVAAGFVQWAVSD